MSKEKEKETREVTPWRPFTELSRMEREAERMFGDFFRRPFWGLNWPDRFREIGIREPAIEIYEEKDDVVVKAEIPGMKKEELDINISDTLLTIKGEKKQEEEVKKKGYYYSERSYGSFVRTIDLPKEVKADKAYANFKDGVLEVRLPKTEEAKRKEVKIKVE
ncbi:MAG TPA: Hsp20/alpha crystallin family protein [Nitrospiria bacterium]|nr:Hsp20/alpha crystallin family protein [Nitrospiria bacterium]